MALVRPYTLLATTNPTSPYVLHENHMFSLKFSDPLPHKIKNDWSLHPLHSDISNHSSPYSALLISFRADKKD